MNIKYITFLLSALFLSVLFYSCNDNNTTTDYGAESPDAQIYSFTMSAPAPISTDSVVRAQDSIRFIQVNKTNYAIDQVSGVIYNPDSMPYGTKLDKGLVTATFNSTYGINRVIVTTPDSLQGYTWNTTDSINFSKGGVKFQVYAANGVTNKLYDIDIRIHQVNPDLIPWHQVTSLPQAGKSKTLLNSNGDKFFTYVISNGLLSLYTIERTGSAWTKENLTGLPATVKTESIFIANKSFYAVDSNGNSYSSADGLSWSQQVNGKQVKSIIGVLPSFDSSGDMLFVTINYNGISKFGRGLDLATVDSVKNINGVLGNQIPSNFPVSDMASYTNFSSNKTDRMLMLSGGISLSNANLPNTWLVKNTKAGIEITTFESKSIFTGGVGLSNFMYNGLYYVMQSNKFYTSDNWGNTWSNAPAGQELNDNVAIRTNQSVIVDSENNMWIFGGVSDGKYLTEVWKGRLNKLNP